MDTDCECHLSISGSACGSGLNHRMGVCCGMAGEHLLPALAALPEQALVVVNGASCWQQIADLSARQPVYLAEALAAAL